MYSILPRRIKVGLIVAMALAALLLPGGRVQADGPEDSVIHACVNANGNVRVVGANASPTLSLPCPIGRTLRHWNINETTLGGFPASSYARLDIGNSFTGNQSITGNVGIGTASPTSTLHVVGAGNITGNTTIGGTLGVTGAISGPNVTSGVDPGHTHSSTSIGGPYLQLQAATPGTAQTGHLNISGTAIAGTFSGSGASLTSLNASNISSGTLADARLSANAMLLNFDQVGAGQKILSPTTNTTGLIVRQTSAVGPTANVFAVQDNAALVDFLKVTSAGNTSLSGTLAATGAISGPNVTSGADPGHTHTSASIGGPYLQLQSATPGTAQTGHLNITGTGLFGGNVGIGTSTPTQKLDVNGNLRLGDMFSSFSLFVNPGSGTGDLTVGAREGGYAQIKANGNQGIFIESTMINPVQGNPAAGFGAIRFVTPNAAGSPLDRIKIGGGQDPAIVAFLNSNVGIGTASPTQKLDVQGGSINTSASLMTGGTARIDVSGNHVNVGNITGTGAVTLTATGGTLAHTATGANVQTFSTNGTERLRVDSAGNIGIGTTSPQQLLVLRGDETASGNQFQISSITSPRTWGIGVGSGGGFSIRDETGFANPIQIVAGAATSSLLIGANSVSLLSGGVSSHIKFSTNATEQMRIDFSGNVGIGTTTPGAKLSVAAGDVATTGAGNGIIVKSPDGLVCRRIGIDNTGAIVAAAVTCP